jgi:hypothetical protein
MATKLISTGIEFPGGTVQTKAGGPINASENFVSNVSTFTVSSIPSFTKLTAIFLVGYTSGPNTPSLVARNTAANYTGTLIGGVSVFFTCSSVLTPIVNKYSGSTTNFFSGSNSYAQFSSVKLELFKITTAKYFWKASFMGGGSNSGPVTMGNGILTMSSSDVTELYLSGATGSGFSYVYSKVYWE